MSVAAHIDLLGRTVKDRVTGMQGVVSAISFDLYGCIQAALTPPVDKDGKARDGHWYDVHRLELLGDKRCMAVPQFDKAPKFGATPATHAHGPAEKPARKERP